MYFTLHSVVCAHRLSDNKRPDELGDDYTPSLWARLISWLKDFR